MKKFLHYFFYVTSCLGACYVIVIGTMALSLEEGYQKNSEKIRAVVNNIPNTKVLEMAPCDRGEISEEKVCITIAIGDQKRMELLYLTEQSCENVGDIEIAQLGSWKFQKCWIGPSGECEKLFKSINIGPNGEFAQMLPVDIKNLQDVIQHYDNITVAIERLPEIPSSIPLTTKQGLTFHVGKQEIEESSKK